MSTPDPLLADESTDGGPGADVLPSGPEVNRYAVPLTTLVGGAFVAYADQVATHPEPAVEAPTFAGADFAGGGGDADGD